MVIRWLGHSSFLIISDDGVKVITDPYTPKEAGGRVGYKPIEISPDIVTISHEHLDHAYIEGFHGQFEVVSQPGVRTIKGVEIKGVKSYHDAEMGRIRGSNTIFLIKVNHVRVCHLGDLGYEVTSHEIESLGDLDVLLIPVGGNFTIGPAEAAHVINRLKPNVVIPMHYKTDKIDSNIGSVDAFLFGKENVRFLDTSEYSITKEQLPSETEIIVLNPEM